ncbi:MAG: ParB/RepB/Spo0J family partition protein [Hyphomicrobiales bacterium]|nr:ParB/RepB/Spo0J family partition protein [Hyphomicrobiales bacterium]
MTKTTKNPAAAAAAKIETPDDKAPIIFVPLNQLTPSPKNVRRYHSEDGITELAASIRFRGLLQNLCVSEGKGGKYQVDAGARRLKAMRRLVSQGHLLAYHPVKCRRAAPDESALDTSLAENFHRENMNAAEEIVAFGQLHKKEGVAPEEIAARYGISHMTVRRRLALANLSPKIIDALASGDVTLEQCEAAALIEDRKRQEAAIFDAPTWQRSAAHIRAIATDGRVGLSDRFAVFVGLPAYEAAGGAVFRDLFADTDEDGAYIEDRALLMRLAAEKIEREAEAIRTAEGWQWAEGALDAPTRWTGPRIHPQELPLNAKDEKRRQKLIARNDEIEAIFQNGDEAEQYDADALSDESDKIAADLDALREKASRYEPAEAALAGVVVSVDERGALTVSRGLVKSDQARALADQRGEATAEDTEQGAAPGNVVPLPAEPDSPYSGALLCDLTKTRTAALAVEIAKRPDVALACSVHALASSLFYRCTYNVVVDMNARGPNLDTTPDGENAAVFAAFSEAEDAWRARLPKKQEALFDWCLDAKPDVLLALLAQCVAMSTNAVQLPHEQSAHVAKKMNHAAQIAQAVSLDMTKHWTASDVFLKRVSKAVITKAATEAGAPGEIVAALTKLPKGEAVAKAKKHLSAWLPDPLRAAAIAAPPDADEDAGEDYDEIAA